MTFDQWWDTLSHKEQLTIGRNNARYVWKSACESCSEICKTEADAIDRHLDMCIEALLDCAEFIKKNGDV